MLLCVVGDGVSVGVLVVSMFGVSLAGVVLVVVDGMRVSVRLSWFAAVAVVVLLCASVVVDGRVSIGVIVGGVVLWLLWR